VCASRAWRNVLVSAYPDTRVGWQPLYAACCLRRGGEALLRADCSIRNVPSMEPEGVDEERLLRPDPRGG